MARSFFLEICANFSFRHTIQSHGWYDLPPFEIDEENLKLSYVFSSPIAAMPFGATISEAAGGLNIEYSAVKVDKKKLAAAVKHILRLDDDLTGFYELIEKGTDLAWVTSSRAGRLLRSPTVFEDLIKTICTTNCSWALTKKMIANLVEKLGEPDANGRRTFPTAKAMAAMPADFYREEIKAGYRSPYFVELTEAIAAGDLDPESWLHSDLPTAELKKEMKKVKGVGDYAAENLLKLVGRYDGLALDSWLRAEFYKKYNREKVCPDKKIEKHYKKFGDWKGLAIWCDMTERWFA
jgi:3-methyladenine DNA glycosylase/8-oxoguanine DNA glycosylase